MIDFNTEPYNDDYAEDDKFYRILFRPSFAVQARELTQLQTILQQQIARTGDHLFKQGAMVIPGQISLDLDAEYIKLVPLYNGVAVETFINQLQDATIVGQSQSLKATVIKVQSSSPTDPTTLYVRYINSGNNGTTKRFANGEVITTADGLYSFQAVADAATGQGSICTIERGVYYVNGFFVLCDKQSLVLEKYSVTPSYRVGLKITESIVTPEDNEQLLDNAQNSYNFAAPGAHRYFIDLTLTKISLTDTADKDFIELLRTDEGVNQKIVNKTEYSYLEKTLARRTYDESGDYTVRDFAIDVREHRTNKRGTWTSNTPILIGDVITYGSNTYFAKNSGTTASTPPTHTSSSAYDGPGNTGINWQYTTSPTYNRGIFMEGDESKLAIGLEPGKAYVRGYEVEKTGTQYVAVSKAREYSQADNAFLYPEMGSYVLVTNLYGTPPITTNGLINLRDQLTVTRDVAAGSVVGTARVRAIEWDNGTLGSTTATYKLFLYNITMNTGKEFNRHVKQLELTSWGFTADVNPITTALIGSVTAAGTTVTGTGTSFLTDLVAGDYIYVNGAGYRVASIASQTSLTLGTSLTATGSAYSLIKSKIVDSDKDALIFKMPYRMVRGLRSSTGTNDTSYTVMGVFSATCTAGVVQISTSSGSFASGAVTGNYILTSNSTGDVILPSAVANNGTSCSITISTAYNGQTITVVAAVNKTGSLSTEKTKTLVSGATKTFTTLATATPTRLYLGKADGWRLTSVKMDTGSFSSPSGTYTIDISDRYTFDDGQRSTHYDLCSIVLKDGYIPPSAPILVEFEYFNHSNGDYCSVSSYPSTVAYTDINPTLRDSLDFRPRMNDDGTTLTITQLPKRGSNVSTDFTYYMPRKEKIAIDINGNFFNVSGSSSLAPGEPPDPSTGMVLYKLSLDAYTGTTDSLLIEKQDNKRYTMRDIGKLEKRIDNLEYYTSLSMLEQSTESFKITDSTGLDRLKNGFIVDNFAGHAVGGTTSPDYICSVDMERGELRPFYTMQNVNMIEKNINNSQRSAAKYQINGDVITLPIIDHVPMIKQEFGSRLENINPFAVFTFIGDVKLTPSSDDWFETNRRPDIVNNIEGNFTTVATLAEKSGALGTVWNAWQNQWAGQPVSSGIAVYESDRRGGDGGASLDAQFGLGPAARGWAHRVVKAEVVAQQIGQSRSGIKTSLVSKVDRQIVADRTLSTAVIPYIRSRNVLVQVRGLKPSTKFYAYFDDVSVGAYITPTSKITYTAGSGTFFWENNVGGLSSETARRINGDSQSCLTRGDVITGVTSGATAVITGLETDPDTGVKAMYVANVIGTFQANEQITGSTSNATGTITSISLKTLGGDIVTNKNGNVDLIFNIPNTDAVRFRTGTREFKLVDSVTATGEYTSRGRSSYRAEGIVETKQATVNAVRNAEIVQEVVGDNRTIVETTQRVISDTGWYDPLAQTFLVDNKGGAFLTKIDIFFATKDDRIPVTLEIRDVVNGYPGKRVLPFSRVTLNPSQVNISNNTVDLDGVTTPKYDTPTTFTFPSPVYVQDASEYCIVLISDSNNYKCWISQMGDTIPGTTRTISEQPYLGSLFKSQNASTWTTDQTQDLMFKIYRAEFDISGVGTVQFVNDVLPYTTLDNNPLQVTTGSNIIRVWHSNHGLTEGSKVTITGVASTIAGIASSQINGSKVVANVDLDSYTITSTSTATSTGYFGGTTVRATGQVQYDVFNPIAQVQNFSETSTTYSVKATTGKSVDGSETPYVQDISFSSCLGNENNYWGAPRVIASEANENYLLSGNKSLTMSVNLSSTNSSLSPVLDTHRLSLVAINNRINKPSHANMDVTPVDYVTLFTGATGAWSVTAAGSTITSTNATVRTLMQTVAVGQWIQVVMSGTGNSGSYLVTSVVDDGTTCTLTVSGTFQTSETTSTSAQTFSTINLFTDDISPLGSSTASKYVTKQVKLALPSTFVKVRFSANIPSASDVEVYYKTTLGTGNLDKTKYILATPTGSVVKTEVGDDRFFDVDYSLTGLSPFDSLQVKLAMKSSNSSAIPRIKDLRIIACA